jgi:DNA-directed RNA polymerase specialized sigma24 family protein
LWRSYFDRLTQFARRKLDQGAGRQADEEDAALSAMFSFYRGVEDGRYKQLAGRDELWRLLVTIVIHKLSRQRRKERTLKRGQGRTRGESAFLRTDDAEEFRGIEQVLGEEPSPEVAALLSEGCERLLESLQDDTLRNVANDKLAGYTNAEIADRLHCTVRSVERKLNRIRSRWSELGEAW